MASIMRPSLLRQTAMASRCAARQSIAARSPFAVNSTIAKATAFHTSAKSYGLLPPGPQVVQGGVNDPVPIPEPNAAHGSYHWAFERLLAAGIAPLAIAPFAAGSLNPTLDAILCSGLLIHSHLGFQSCIIDYVPKREHPGLHRASWWLLNLATVTVGIGLYEFETNDVGVTEAIKRVWKA